MFCTKCGLQVDEQVNFCSQCGTATGRGPLPIPQKRLKRSIVNSKLAGVCGGMAEYIEADPVIVRLLWVVLSLGLPPAGILGYIIAWIVVPKEQLSTMSYAPLQATPQS